MTDADLDALERAAREAKERADAATGGTWYVVGDEVHFNGSPFMATIRDVEFIAAARQDVPQLADAVLALLAEVRFLRGINHNEHHGTPAWEMGRREGLRQTLETVQIMLRMQHGKDDHDYYVALRHVAITIEVKLQSS